MSLILELLTIRQDTGSNWSVSQPFKNPIEIKRGDGGIAHHQILARAQMTLPQRRLTQNALADVNRILAGLQFHFQNIHSV